MQAFSLSADLWDANSRNESLRSELNDIRDRLHKVERIRDRLDMELNFEWRMSALAGTRQAPHYPHGSRKNHKHLPDLIRVRGKVRHDEIFPGPGGGLHTTWITDGSSASDWDDDKENCDPTTKEYTLDASHFPQPLASTSRGRSESLPC